MNRDKKGRPIKDDSAMQQEMATAGVGGGEGGYEPYVVYEFELS